MMMNDDWMMMNDDWMMMNDDWIYCASGANGVHVGSCPAFGRGRKNHRRRGTPTADTRAARRAAEKAALDALNGSLVGSAGDLGVADAGRQDAAATLADAHHRAEKILAAARREAAEFVKAAENMTRQADEAYTAAWNTARESGWNPAQLRAMGYTKPATTRRASITDDTTSEEQQSGDREQLKVDGEQYTAPTTAVAVGQLR